MGKPVSPRPASISCGVFEPEKREKSCPTLPKHSRRWGNEFPELRRGQRDSPEVGMVKGEKSPHEGIQRSKERGIKNTDTLMRGN